MSFSDKNPAIVTRAVTLCGWDKAVMILPNGSLEWYGAEGHPTDDEINAKMSEAEAAYEAQASSRQDGNGALNAPKEAD